MLLALYEAKTCSHQHAYVASLVGRNLCGEIQTLIPARTCERSSHCLIINFRFPSALESEEIASAAMLFPPCLTK